MDCPCTIDDNNSLVSKLFENAFLEGRFCLTHFYGLYVGFDTLFPKPTFQHFYNAKQTNKHTNKAVRTAVVIIWTITNHGAAYL